MRTVFQARINELETLCKKQEYEVAEFRSAVEEMKLEITRLSDVEAQLNTQKGRNSQLDEQKSTLQSEQLTASDYILELEHKLYKANKTSLELIRLLKEAETEIETLQKEVVELKQRFALYIPVKDDPIDRRLAEFINNYPDR